GGQQVVATVEQGDGRPRDAGGFAGVADAVAVDVLERHAGEPAGAEVPEVDPADVLAGPGGDVGRVERRLPPRRRLLRLADAVGARPEVGERVRAVGRRRGGEQRGAQVGHVEQLDLPAAEPRL